MGKTCEKVRAFWYFKNYVWWLTCQGCSDSINCFLCIHHNGTAMNSVDLVQYTAMTQSKNIWGWTKGGTHNGHMEEKSRLRRNLCWSSWTNTWSRSSHRWSSRLQQLTTRKSSIIIKILPHRSGLATASDCMRSRTIHSWTHVRLVPFLVHFEDLLLEKPFASITWETVLVPEMRGAGHAAILTCEILTEWNIAYIANVVYKW